MAIRDAVKVSEGARLDFLYGTETLQAERTCYAVAYFIVAIMNGAGGPVCTTRTTEFSFSLAA
jgi:hypothetical protein